MPSIENQGFQRLPTDEGSEGGPSDQAPPYQPPQPQPQSQPQLGPYYDDPNRGPQQWVSSQQVIVPGQQFLTAPTVQTMGIAVQSRPTDWTIPAILACIFCFWPTGIFAIVFANRAVTSAGMGDMIEATRSARLAKIMTIVSLVIGIVIVVASTLAIVIPIVAFTNAMGDSIDGLNAITTTSPTTFSPTKYPNWQNY